MSRCRGLVFHLSKRQPCYRRCLSTGSAHIDNSASAASDSTVAPSQVIRYALSGDPETHTTTIRKTTRNNINNDLELILSKRKLDKQHWLGRLISLPGGARVPTELRNVSNLQELKLWFEQYIAAGFVPRSALNVFLKDVLVRCEKSSSSLEISSLLTTVISRHKDAGVPVGLAIRNAGLYYAFQSFSVPAIRHYLHDLATYRVVLGVKNTEVLTQGLLRTLRTVRFADPAYDTRPLLELMAERPLNPKLTFFAMAKFREGTNSPFIELLCELGASKAHEDMWDKLVEHITRRQRSRKGLTSALVDDAYKSIVIYLKFGMTDYAMSCMNFMSKTVKDMSPSLHLSTELAAILNEKGLEVPAIVEAPIQKALSQALEQQDSASTVDVKFDDGMVDFSIVQSLLARINDNGTSVSASKIAVLIDALNDCAGLTIPLFIELFQDHGIEYAWSPQWIPGVSDSSRMSFTQQDSQTLGLLRARIASRGIIVSSERSRNLVQLGHLMRREFIPDSIQNNETNPWTKTGYLVVFDRISAEYLIIYMGEDITIIDPEYQPHTEQDSFIDYEQHPLLGSLSHVAMPASAHDFDRGISEVITPVKNAANRYVLDLDSGVSLQP
ncbi:hypothetical protein DPV78_004066 [Talaromyces pinophilus]|nr:hypothetical protein DPV78_004066 [Talaromyces pinophilus]